MKKHNKGIIGALLATCMVAGLALGGCGGIKTSETVASMGDKKITYGMANFVLRIQQAQYDTYRSMMGDDMWNQDMSGSGQTLADTTKQGVMDSFKEMLALDARASEYNISINEEETDKMKAAAKSFMEKNAGAVKGYLATTEEDVVEVLRLYTIQAKMKAEITKDVDHNVSDEEALHKKISYSRVDLKENDASGASVAVSDDKKAELKASMEKLLADCKAGKDMKELSDEIKATSMEYSYGKDDENLQAEVVKEADKLKNGEYSGLIETEDYIYIVRMEDTFDKEETDKAKKTIVQKRIDEKFAEVVKGWVDEATLEINDSVWSKVTFDKTLALTTEQKGE